MSIDYAQAFNDALDAAESGDEGHARALLEKALSDIEARVRRTEAHRRTVPRAQEGLAALVDLSAALEHGAHECDITTLDRLEEVRHGARLITRSACVPWRGRETFWGPSAVGVASLCSCFDAMFGKYWQVQRMRVR